MIRDFNPFPLAIVIWYPTIVIWYPNANFNFFLFLTLINIPNQEQTDCKSKYQPDFLVEFQAGGKNYAVTSFFIRFCGWIHRIWNEVPGSLRRLRNTVMLSAVELGISTRSKGSSGFGEWEEIPIPRLGFTPTSLQTGEKRSDRKSFLAVGNCEFPLDWGRRRLDE